MRLLKTIAVILGIVMALAGVVSVTTGGFVLGVYRAHGAASGFFSTPSRTVGSNGFALTAPDINGQLAAGWQRWVLSRAEATVRVSGVSKLPAPLFVGIAPTAAVSEYLSGVARDRITGIDFVSGSVDYDHVDGKRIPAPPQEQRFWEAKASGSGSQTLEWSMREGDWAVVIMNGDGSAPVAADLRLGARFGIIYPLMAGLTVLGVVLLGVGAVLILRGSAARGRTLRLDKRLA